MGVQKAQKIGKQKVKGSINKRKPRQLKTIESGISKAQSYKTKVSKMAKDPITYAKIGAVRQAKQFTIGKAKGISFEKTKVTTFKVGKRTIGVVKGNLTGQIALEATFAQKEKLIRKFGAQSQEVIQWGKDQKKVLTDTSLWIRNTKGKLKLDKSIAKIKVLKVADLFIIASSIKVILEEVKESIDEGLDVESGLKIGLTSAILLAKLVPGIGNIISRSLQGVSSLSGLLEVSEDEEQKAQSRTFPNSSFIGRIIYMPNTKSIIVEFKDGSSPVSINNKEESEYLNFTTAPSVGKYFNLKYKGYTSDSIELK